MTAEESALSVEGLSFGYGGRAILNDIDFRVAAGESLAVVGRSGSGKSTLLSCVLGLLVPATGSVHIDGVTVDARRARAVARLRRAKVGMVFQGGELLPELSPVENVVVAGLLGGLPAQVARSRADELLTRLGVPDGRRVIGEFSGGEQQRVAVVRALMNRPRLLLADEPTGSLDVETRDEVADLLHGLPQAFGCAMVIVTHDPAVATRCTRVASLTNGELRDGVPSWRR
ncbi:MAG: ABC transporter ATP-binding protein [Nocardioides sp.]